MTMELAPWLRDYCCPYHHRMKWPHVHLTAAERTQAAQRARERRRADHERRKADLARLKSARARQLAIEQGIIRDPEYSEIIPADPGWYVYRLWAADGKCLYVGMVGENGPRKVGERLAEHKRLKPWWTDVARVDAANCGRWGSAAEEIRQTLALEPVHNILIGRYRHRPHADAAS